MADKTEVQDILDRVGQVEDERAKYREMAIEWEKMWRLEHFKRSSKEAVEIDGQEQVTMPTPFNVVNLAQRLFSSVPKIEVPANDANNEADEAAGSSQYCSSSCTKTRRSISSAPRLIR